MPPGRKNNKKEKDEIDASLLKAITSVSSPRLQEVLKSIVDACPDAKKLAKKMLLVEEDDDDGDLYEYNEDEHVNTNRKRERSGQRYELCVQCKKEYDVLLDDDEDDCVWHDGKYFLFYDSVCNSKLTLAFNR